MAGRWRSTALFSLLLGLLVSCDPAAKSLRPDTVEPSAAEVVDDSGQSYTLVEGSISPDIVDLTVSRTIGAEGGSLSLAGHTLTVPAGAVEEPAVFTLTLLTNGYVQVELTALGTDALGSLVDVGEQGFARPVPLSLTYSWATNVEDPGRLRILHLRDDGTAEPLASTLDPTGRTVTAELEHFSAYCLASD